MNLHATRKVYSTRLKSWLFYTSWDRDFLNQFDTTGFPERCNDPFFVKVWHHFLFNGIARPSQMYNRALSFNLLYYFAIEIKKNDIFTQNWDMELQLSILFLLSWAGFQVQKSVIMTVFFYFSDYFYIINNIFSYLSIG